MVNYGWMIAFIVAALFALNFFWLYRKGIARRLNVENYVIYLLLSDETREDHKRKFIEWVTEAEADNASDLGFQAHNVVDTIADQLGEKDSTLAATTMIWNIKKEQTM